MEAAGESLRYEYDAAGNVTRTVAGESETLREYDNMSRLVYQKDAEGFETRYRYDAAGKTVAVYLADGGMLRYNPCLH